MAFRGRYDVVAAFRGRCGVVTEFSRALRDLAGQLARPSGRAAWFTDLAVAPRALRWVLPWAILGRCSRDANPYRWFAQQVKDRPSALGLASPAQQASFGELEGRCDRVATFLYASGVRGGDRVAIQTPTSVELVVVLLACWRLGAVPCPLDPALPIALKRQLQERLAPQWWLDDTATSPADDGIGRICLSSIPDASSGTGETLGTRAQGGLRAPIPRMHASHTALILPTSGTEGTIKLCRLSAGRLALSGHAFGGLALRCRAGDVIYCPLPLHHATGITVALMSALVQGVALYLPGQFSATHFWDQLVASRATQLVYVGDLLRYAAKQAPKGERPGHSLRVAVGNGLDARTWQMATELLGSSQIIEFYGATEAPSALLNFAGKPGSIGRVPLRRLSRYTIVRWQATSETEAERDGADASEAAVATDRDGAGRWVRCGAGEVGELWIRVPRGKRPWLGDFEGYLSAADDHRALVQNVFQAGDAYYRTYDLVRYDEDDFLYFVDRVGEIWRHKGHNVSTSWLAEELRDSEGISDAVVTAVALDGTSRRFGLAVVVTSGGDWRVALERRFRALPSWARPHFVKVVRTIPRTATHKPKKSDWRRRPWDPFEGQPDVNADDGSARVAADATFLWRAAAVSHSSQLEQAVSLVAASTSTVSANATPEQVEASLNQTGGLIPITRADWDTLRRELLGATT